MGYNKKINPVSNKAYKKKYFNAICFDQNNLPHKRNMVKKDELQRFYSHCKTLNIAYINFYESSTREFSHREYYCSRSQSFIIREINPK